MNNDALKGAQDYLRQQAKIISDTPTEKMLQTDRFGIVGGFTELAPLFERTKRLLKALSESDFTLLSQAKLDHLASLTQNILARFQEFMSYSPGSNPTQERAIKIRNYMETFDAFFDNVAPIIALPRVDLIDKQVQVSNLLEELNEIKLKAQKEVAERNHLVLSISSL